MGERVRLGRAGRGGQVLLEDLARGAVVEATARGVVDPVGEAAEPGPREGLGLAVAGKEAAYAAVRVLDGPFLPGAHMGSCVKVASCLSLSRSIDCRIG